MKFFEAKIFGVIMYILVNAVGFNYAFYCMNQKSNVWLTMGFLLGLVMLLFNGFILRKLITSKIKEGEKVEKDTL